MGRSSHPPGTGAPVGFIDGTDTPPADRFPSLEPPLGTSATTDPPRKRVSDWKRFLKLARLAKELPSTDKGRAALKSCVQCCSSHDVFLDSKKERTEDGWRYCAPPLSCDKRYCPRCVVHWSANASRRLLSVATDFHYPKLRHIVLTVPNAPDGGLAHTIDGLFKSFREWKNDGRRNRTDPWWKCVSGFAAKLEIDYSKTRGWHPHLHVLAVCKESPNLRKNSVGRRRWAEITYSHLGKAAIGLWITRCETPNAAMEVAKYCAKPLQLAGMSPVTLAELADAMAGRRWWQSFGDLRCPLSDPPSGDWTRVGTLNDLAFGTAVSGLSRDTELDLLNQYFRDYAGDDEARERCGLLRRYLGLEEQRLGP
jgi:hypothetical protein